MRKERDDVWKVPEAVVNKWKGHRVARWWIKSITGLWPAADGTITRIYRETEKAILVELEYPLEQADGTLITTSDEIWVPKSIVDRWVRA